MTNEGSWAAGEPLPLQIVSPEQCFNSSLLSPNLDTNQNSYRSNNARKPKQGKSSRWPWLTSSSAAALEPQSSVQEFPLLALSSSRAGNRVLLLQGCSEPGQPGQATAASPGRHGQGQGTPSAPRGKNCAVKQILFHFFTLIMASVPFALRLLCPECFIT